MDIKAYLMGPVPRWVALSVVTATGVGATAVTYVYMRRKFVQTLDELVKAEIAGTEKFLSSLSTKKFSTPMEAAEALDLKDVEEIIEDEKYSSDDETGDLVEVAHNVFTNMKQLSEDELSKRGPEKPYVITSEEFFESENQMITITWYEGDGVLADEKDSHVPDIDRVVGEENLGKFGYGSDDPNIVYVRNEKMEVDFEITRNEGKYTEQVLGFKHEDRDDRRGPRKFRTYDD